MLGVGSERDVRLRLGDARDLVELIGYDRGDLLVLAHPDQGDEIDLPLMSKREMADRILDEIVKLRKS